MLMNCLLILCSFLNGTQNQENATASILPEASPDHLPQWRGFNLLGLFHRDWTDEIGYQEKDFQLISELGFNFVRLPMDYRFWILDNDWEQIDDTALLKIDEAISYGEKYNIHVSLNFHRAPGHTVAEPKETTNLWQDAEAQRVCALHWQHFARRYRDIPNSHLSFNLFNEPHGIDENTYTQVVSKILDAIRAVDPERLVIIDGLEWGKFIVEEAIPLGVAQATRGYEPASISHYRASWITGSDNWPVPRWPIPGIGGGFLYGPMQSALHAPLTIQCDFDHPVTLTVMVGTVSTAARLALIKEDEVIDSQVFTPGPGEGPWKEVVYRPEYNCYQNIYDMPVEFIIPPGKHTLILDNVEGDWLTLKHIAIGDGHIEYDSIDIYPQWGAPNQPIVIDPDTKMITTSITQNADWLWNTYYQHWADLRERGVGVMVGEWGAFQHTPHDVTLHWMEDCLKSYARAGIGWALWNFRGSFGILDSNRQDVEYEAFHGHLLDRKMLELLQRY